MSSNQISNGSISTSKDVMVSARGISKSYVLMHNRPQHTTLGEATAHRLRAPFQRTKQELFWPLRDISFDVQRGEVLGIIGRNGAGKSTLLKILSRITAPTTGQIDLYGSLGSLLEVGTGFHPELTGRENIFLNGAILGMQKREIEKQFDAIVDFAGTEQFLDTPVKRYSSGMYVRLAFAVAAHLRSEILIVDEVLAVGDVQFQKKCLDKMHDVTTEDGKTVLFVSHNMVAVKSLCSRTLLLQNGQILFDGDTQQASDLYLSSIGAKGTSEIPGEFDLTQRENIHLPGVLIIRKVKILGTRGQITDTIPMGEEMSVVIDVEGLPTYSDLVIGVQFKSEMDQTVTYVSTRMKPALIQDQRQENEQVVVHIPRVQLTPGLYSIDVTIKNPRGNERIDRIERAASFHIIEADVFGTGFHFVQGECVMFIDSSITIRAANEVDNDSLVPV